MEGPWRCYGVAHGVHQNAPKCTEMVTMHHSMTEQSVSNLSRVTYIFEINGHLKEARSQSMSWRGHRVALEVHQNEPKCTKKVTYARRKKKFRICPQWLICTWGSPKQETVTEKVLWIKYMVHFGAAHALPHEPSTICSDFYTLPDVHFIQKWIILVTQDEFKILCSVMPWWPFWYILVLLMCDPLTCSATLWLALTPILFQVSF